MRWFFVLMLVALAGCQGTKATTEPDYGEKAKQCDPRAVESGLCVPGGYEDSY